MSRPGIGHVISLERTLYQLSCRGRFAMVNDLLRCLANMTDDFVVCNHYRALLTIALMLIKSTLFSVANVWIDLFWLKQFYKNLFFPISRIKHRRKDKNHVHHLSIETYKRPLHESALSSTGPGSSVGRVSAPGEREFTDSISGREMPKSLKWH